jgi:hypothetical protein
MSALPIRLGGFCVPTVRKLIELEPFREVVEVKLE